MQIYCTLQHFLLLHQFLQLVQIRDLTRLPFYAVFLDL